MRRAALVLVGLACRHYSRCRTQGKDRAWWTRSAITIFPWAIAALIVGSPLAFLLGRSLRRVTRISVHLLLFAAFGLLLGVVASAVATPLINLSDAPPTEYWESILDSLHFIIGAVLASAIAVPLGWWITAKLALRADSRRSAPAPVSAWEPPAA